MNCTGAATPPTVTPVFWTGRGRSLSGVPTAGAAPSKTPGETPPTPVTYIVRIWLRAPLENGTGAPCVSVKIPGAPGPAVRVVVAVCPLLFTTNGTLAPTGVA